MLELCGLKKRFGAWELPGLDLALEPGEYFMLLGPSGVGKSVTLELIAGLQRPDSGQILWKGQDITHSSPEKRPFAIVYQDCALFPHLSVRANIAYGPKVAGVGRVEIDQRVDELAELVRITDLLDRRVVSLSGGEEQRVALARALVTRPELLLLDEPLSALDASIREYLRGELQRLHKESGAIFLHVTHAQREARHLADRVGVVLDGRLEQVATSTELFRRPTSRRVSEFLGLRNLLDLRCSEPGRGEARGVGIRGEALLPGRANLWIRPEEITLTRGEPRAPNVLEARVISLEDVELLTTFRLACGELELVAMVPEARARTLGVGPGDRVFASFGDDALHSF